MPSRSIIVPHLFFFRCLEHVVNLANVDIMAHITKVAVIETSTAIWEFDPTLPDNCLHGKSLDAIAAIRTVAIKVSHQFLIGWEWMPMIRVLDTSVRPKDRVLQQITDPVRHQDCTEDSITRKHKMGLGIRNARQGL
jgi:hypothetical protein